LNDDILATPEDLKDMRNALIETLESKERILITHHLVSFETISIK